MTEQERAAEKASIGPSVDKLMQQQWDVYIGPAKGPAHAKHRVRVPRSIWNDMCRIFRSHGIDIDDDKNVFGVQEASRLAEALRAELKAIGSRWPDSEGSCIYDVMGVLYRGTGLVVTRAA